MGPFDGLITLPDGTQQWWSNNCLHREDGPATITPTGEECWWFGGKVHRTDGPAFSAPDGRREWVINGRLHRTDGPATIGPDGTQMWSHHGAVHRTDGPAVIRPDGTTQWWWDDEQVTSSQAESDALGALAQDTRDSVRHLYNPGDDIVSLCAAAAAAHQAA
jgi:hypothetical protein